MSKNWDRYNILLSAVLIHLCMGSVYAWSIMAIPLQRIFNEDLAAITGVFSVAIFYLGLTASLYGKILLKIGPRYSTMLTAIIYYMGIVLSHAGMAVKSFSLLCVGYGVLCGIAFGMGYLTPIATVRSAFPESKGLVTGIVIMCFGLGAAVNSFLMNNLMPHIGVPMALLIVGALYATIIGVASFGFPKRTEENTVRRLRFTERLYLSKITKTFEYRLLWCFMLINISSGIGLIGVAVPMLHNFGNFSLGASALFVGAIGVCNAIGRVIGGYVADRFSVEELYIGIMLYTSLVVSAIIAAEGPVVFVTSMCLLAVSYGAGFAVLPSMIEKQFGAKFQSILHGKVLLSWGIAGVAAPSYVSYLYVMTHDYFYAMFGLFATINTFLLVCVAWMKYWGRN